MTRTPRLIALIAAGAIIGHAGPISAQSGENGMTFSGRTVTGIGLVARDAVHVATALSETFGLEKPSAPRDVKPDGFPASYKGDRSAYTKVVDVRFANLTVQVMQPMGGASPWKEYLDRTGGGIFHVAFSVPDVEAQARVLQGKGGVLVVGKSGGSSAVVDMGGPLGVHLALSKGEVPPLSDAARQQRAKEKASGGLKEIARVGVLVSDTDKARAGFVDTFGVTLPQPVDERGALKFPESFTGDRTAGMRHVFVPFDNIWINVIQPVGGESPWRDMVKRNARYLLFAVDDVEGTAQMLEKRGGTRTLGVTGTPYAYVDLPQFGFTAFLLKAGILPR